MTELREIKEIQIISEEKRKLNGFTKSDEYSKNEKIESNCNSITFMNVGNDDAFIDHSIPLPKAPAGSKSYPSFSILWDKEVIDKTYYSLSFAAIGLSPKIVVIRQYIS